MGWMNKIMKRFGSEINILCVFRITFNYVGNLVEGNAMPDEIDMIEVSHVSIDSLKKR